MDKHELYQAAHSKICRRKLRKFGEAGHVACALESANGEVYTGICIDLPCSIGLCAEQAAIAEMIKSGQTKIKRIIAVYQDGSILPPCGRCREFIAQIDDENRAALVVMPEMREVALENLLPERWDSKWS